MAVERTLAIVKPDAVGRSLVGDILRRSEGAGLRICALKLVHLTRGDAERFYLVHRERPFYDSLCSYMSSGPVVACVLAGEGAITRWRELMGATDPVKAAAGTIRKDFGVDVEKNAVHGSDGPDTAAQEIPFFFNVLEIQP
jgi:nucleoside-diphosphate kinase